MRVTEIFSSIQGESTFAGLPCTFVRLTGCPLRCAYCDTAYAFSGGTEMGLDEILARVADHGVALVEVTGGEPLAQKETPALLARLLAAGHQVLLETSNALPIDTVPKGIHVILDLKSPGSGALKANQWENLDRLDERGEIKFVLTNRADFDWAVETIESRRLAGRWPLLLAPVFGELDPADLAAWIVEAHLPVRLQLQLHKLIWGAERTGV